MSELVFREIDRRRDETSKWKDHHIAVTKETHERVRIAAEKSGLFMKDMSEILVKYALDHIEWK